MWHVIPDWLLDFSTLSVIEAQDLAPGGFISDISCFFDLLARFLSIDRILES